MYGGGGLRVGRAEDALPADGRRTAVRRLGAAAQAHVRRGPGEGGRGSHGVWPDRGVAAEIFRRPDDGHTGRAVAERRGRRRQRQGHRTGPGAVRPVQGHAGGLGQRRAVRYGRGTGRDGHAGRAGRPAGRGRVAPDGRGGVQAQRRGARRPDSGHGAARAQVRRGRGQDRRQGVHGGLPGRQAGRIRVRDAGRGGRLRRVHQTAGQR